MRQDHTYFSSNPDHQANQWESSGSTNEYVQQVANNGRRAQIGEDQGLNDIVNKNNSQPGPLSQNLLAITVQAIIGAVFKDGGLEAATRVMRTWGVLIPTT